MVLLMPVEELLKAMPSDVQNQYSDVEVKCLKVVRNNARYFVPAIRMDKILFLFIRLRLFWLYKRIYRLLRR